MTTTNQSGFRLRLRNVGDRLLVDELDYSMIAKATREYFSLLLDISQLDLEREPHLKDRVLHNGIALGTSWAARCVEDIIRTRQFIRGLNAVISDRLTLGQKPLRLLYAGSGPFAALILPLLTRYTPDQLQVGILEINPHSMTSVRNLITRLSFDDHIAFFAQSDATTYRIPTSWSPDILLSETMQHALLKELQLPIFLNLVPQLRPEAEVIPECVDVRLASVSLDHFHEPTHHDLGEVLRLDTRFVQRHARNWRRLSAGTPLCKVVFLPHELESFPRENLALTTEITVYKNIRIRTNESGLTIPKMLFLSRESSLLQAPVEVRYFLSPEPHFQWISIDGDKLGESRIIANSSLKTMPGMFIRPETPADHPAVFALIARAFADDTHSDRREQFLVDRLRRSDAFLPELSLVADLEDRIIGHVLLTRIRIRDGDRSHPALALAPVSVLPEYQGRGVGGELIRAAHATARELGFSAVVVLGHAAYYPRFGYRPAHEFGINFPFAAPPENCMVLALTERALRDVKGTVQYPPEFFE